jgi:formate dehydrogenase iron-sulfur subunit
MHFAHAQATLGCQAHGTSADGSVTLEPVYCLGLCAQSPAVMVDESEVHARMTADRLDALLEEIQQKQLETKADEAQAAIENEAVAATRIYVPRDAAALAVGADAVAQALQRECEARGLAVELVRNGSRGLLWLETLVEVETAQGRVAYGPVQADAGSADAGMLQGQSHALCHGLTEQMPYLARQERLTLRAWASSIR